MHPTIPYGYGFSTRQHRPSDRCRLDTDLTRKCLGYFSTWSNPKYSIDHDYVIKRKPFSALLAICAGNSPVTGEFPSQKPVTRSIDVFFDLRLNKTLSKQWWGWWFETLSRPLWRHCNVYLPCGYQTRSSYIILQLDMLPQHYVYCICIFYHVDWYVPVESTVIVNGKQSVFSMELNWVIKNNCCIF